MPITFENGGADVGTKVENGELYYTRNKNKVAAAIAKNAGLLNFDANGNCQVCPVDGVGPFVVSGNNSLIGDLRQEVYDRDGVWICLRNSDALKPNDIVKRSGATPGYIAKYVKGTDTPDLAVGIYLGLLEQGAELSSKDVLQAATTGNGQLCVIEFKPVF
jgi:hypothetical protein